MPSPAKHLPTQDKRAAPARRPPRDADTLGSLSYSLTVLASMPQCLRCKGMSAPGRRGIKKNVRVTQAERLIELHVQGCEKKVDAPGGKGAGGGVQGTTP